MLRAKRPACITATIPGRPRCCAAPYSESVRASTRVEHSSVRPERSNVESKDDGLRLELTQRRSARDGNSRGPGSARYEQLPRLFEPVGVEISLEQRELDQVMLRAAA